MLLTGLPLPGALVVPVAIGTILTGSAYKVVLALEAATLPAGDTELASLVLPSGAKLCACGGRFATVNVLVSLPPCSP